MFMGSTLWPIVADPARQALLADFACGQRQDHRGGLRRRNVEIDFVEAKEHDDRGKRRALVAVNERMVARYAEAIGSGERCEVSLPIGKLVERPAEGRFEQPEIANPVGSSKEGQLLGMNIKNDGSVE